VAEVVADDTSEHTQRGQSVRQSVSQLSSRQAAEPQREGDEKGAQRRREGCVRGNISCMSAVLCVLSSYLFLACLPLPAQRRRSVSFELQRGSSSSSRSSTHTEHTQHTHEHGTAGNLNRLACDMSIPPLVLLVALPVHSLGPACLNLID
jgi:hypothetical protein